MKFIVFFISTYNIIIKYDKSYYTYIKLFNKTIFFDRKPRMNVLIEKNST